MDFILSKREHCRNKRIRLLGNLCIFWQCLEIGGALLPDLIALYQWFNTNLAHLLTHERASSITIGHVISLAAKKHGKGCSEHIDDLYKRVKERYNEYSKSSNDKSVRDCIISDDTPLLRYLTGTMNSVHIEMHIALMFEGHCFIKGLHQSSSIAPPTLFYIAASTISGNLTDTFMSQRYPNREQIIQVCSKKLDFVLSLPM